MTFLRDIESVVSLFGVDVDRLLNSAEQVKDLLGPGPSGKVVAHYEGSVGADADAVQRNADAGTFRSQVERLFGLASRTETAAFEAIARSVVSTCLTNRYYRPADYLSDVVDALERRTFLGPGEAGEPPLRGLDPERRRDKIDRVCGAWLVADKVAALESVVATHARVVGTALPYAALARFEREAAQLFSLLELAEVKGMERELATFLEAWRDQAGPKRRFPEPARGLQAVRHALEGRLEKGEGEGLRSRMGWPLRLCNAVAEDRQHVIALALARLGVEVVKMPVADTSVLEPARTAFGGRATPPRGEMPPASPGHGDDAPEEDASGPLRLLLPCPKCGGSFTADDETVSVECEYCGSLLILSASERDEVYVDEDRFEGAADVLDTVILYRVQAHRAELVGAYRKQQQDPEAMPSEAWLRSRTAAFEQRLRAATRVLGSDRLFVPYWHLTGLVVQGAVGRDSEGPKVARVRAWAVEHTVPAYDGDRFDLRDRGLRLAHGRVLPLTVERVRAAGKFLPFSPLEERSYREVDRWKTRELVKGFESVARHGEVLFVRRMVAYRPYWLVQLTSAEGAAWILGDGAFRTIAGYPAEDEVLALRSSGIADPLRSSEPSFRHVEIAASRCPDCGHEQHFDPHDHVATCPNCHLGLEAAPGGVRVVGYDHVVVDGQAAEGDHLPFWRFPFTLTLAGGDVVRDLDALRSALFPDGGPFAWTPRGDALWIPAFRLLGSEPGDDAFRRLVEWMHGRSHEVAPGKVPLGLRTTRWGASLSAAEAKELGRFALVALHSTASAARMTTMLFNRAVAKAHLELGTPRLTYVPFDREDRELALPGTPARVPLLLLTGGPELEAIRLSVHRIARDL